MKTWFLISTLAALFIILVTMVARRHERALLRRRRIRIDRFKLRRKQAIVEQEVMTSPEVREQISRWADEHDVSEAQGRRKAQEYFQEIVPKFNLLAYYGVGAPVARAFLYFLYRVVVERNRIRQFSESVPKGTVVVFVINHRSNADYVLVAHMLFKFISLSYAVGEWARVWPLNHLFKWFGAYFIRRGYREPLYHVVLSSYVRTITRNGVIQGVFLEGGLSRDGAFRKPKVGMLDYLVSSKRDPEFTAPLYLIPTAINYDRVLEDRVLTEELMGRERRATRWGKLRQTGGFLFKNTIRSMLQRFKRYGLAVVAFGNPVLVDEFVRRNPEVLASEFETRKPALQKLADTIMLRISDAMPHTPVSIVAWLFTENGNEPLTERQLLLLLDKYRDRWHDQIWQDADYTSEKIWTTAREVLRLRKLLVETERGWSWSPADLLLRDYYANALIPYAEVRKRGWGGPATRPGEDSARG